MKRTALTAALILTVALSATGQGYRTMSVWQDGKAKNYSLLTMDSLVAGRYDGKAVVYYENSSYSRLRTDSVNLDAVDSITVSAPAIASTNKRSLKELVLEFRQLDIKTSTYKKTGNHNPLMGHKFGADPFGMVDGDRLYVYMTDDHIFKADGTPVGGSDYSDCKNVSIISSDDLVNWTDHGAQPVAGKNGGTGPAKWANNMWAPCAAHKTVNGKEKYFLYFADNSNGIGVLTADSPYGPWQQPTGMNQLISRNTPNCSTVTWLFDPAVLVDTDGKAYLYFGGGVPSGKDSNPGTARCVQLGDDMISLAGNPVAINPPYLFEDAGINKIGDKYIYSYCSNWAQNSDPGVANIAYMESDQPLGPYTYVGRCFDNPVGASWAGGGGNNHHSIVKFKGKYYILYHTRALKKAMRTDYPAITDDMEVRSACLSRISVDEERSRIVNLSSSAITIEGVDQIRNFNPYREVPGPTMAWERNVTTKYFKSGNQWVCTAEMGPGSWMCLSKVDFGSGAIGFKAKVKGKGIIGVTTGYPGSSGNYVAVAEVDSPNGYTEVQVPLMALTSGVKDELYITTAGSVSLESWTFIGK